MHSIDLNQSRRKRRKRCIAAIAFCAAHIAPAFLYLATQSGYRISLVGTDQLDHIQGPEDEVTYAIECLPKSLAGAGQK
jgi:hypothetical protein